MLFLPHEADLLSHDIPLLLSDHFLRSHNPPRDSVVKKMLPFLLIL
ncbi:hypothetical protein CP8484711_2122A, partial [Chlamydia psittaci 84-8471/1]